MGNHLLLCTALLLLCACAQRVVIVEEESPEPSFGSAYVDAARQGAAVYRVVTHESWLLVHVGRAGSTRNLGHEHAIASEDLRGYVALFDDTTRSRADIAFPVRNLVVDAPVFRQRLGLDDGPSKSDIESTYANMLKVLGPEVFSWAEIAVRIASYEPTIIAASITLHGSTAEYRIPVQLKHDAGRLSVTGQISVRHSDFGLTPYTALGGLLQVADELTITFEISAVAESRIEPSAIAQRQTTQINYANCRAAASFLSSMPSNIGCAESR